MIDLNIEHVLRLNEARRLTFLKGRKGNHISLCTMDRWGRNGILVNGERIVLETVKIGGTVCTSVEAVERFVNRLNTSGPRTQQVSSASRRRSLAKAEATLDREGIR